SAGNQLHERNHDTHRPKRPDRQKRIGERQEVFARVIEWSELENLHDSGHKENQPENQTRKQDGPRSINISSWFSQFLLTHNRFSFTTIRLTLVSLILTERELARTGTYIAQKGRAF